MGFLQELQKGFRFQVCGLMSDPLVFKDDSGETNRFVRIAGFNKTFSLAVNSDAELAVFPAVGTSIRATGMANRRNKSLFCGPRVTEMIFPGRPGWKDLTDDEVLAGAVFAGWGMLMDKRSGTYAGVDYRKIIVGGWGDSFEFRDIPEALFDSLPDESRVPLYISGRLDPVLSQLRERGTENRVVSADMAYVVEGIKVGDASSRPADPGAGARSPREKAAA